MDDIDVKKIRADKGITQRELADLAGVNLSTVWRWENGSPPRGTARTLLLSLAPSSPKLEERA